MYKRIVGFTVIWLGVVLGAVGAQELAWEDIGRSNHDAQVILVNPSNNKIIFAGLPGNVLKSEDNAKSWRVVLSLRGGQRNINALAIGVSNANVIYAVTDNGLYRSNNLGSRWDRIFRGKNNLENQCTAILEVASTLFVGTRAGLFMSRDGGRNWDKKNSIIANASVLNIDYCRNQNSIIYLAATRGIFKSVDSGENWEKISQGYLRENSKDESGIKEEDVREESSDLRFVKAGINNVNLVYFSCSKGVYKSLNQGKSWDKLSEYGLLNRDVKIFCLAGDSEIYGLSQEGVFLFKDERWSEVTFGLAAGKLNNFVLDNYNNLYLVGKNGIFRASQKSKTLFSPLSLIQEYLKTEPSIKNVQAAAIKYAEVSPEKIIQWRKEASRKAMLPQVSIGLDRNTTDLWHWEGGSTTKSDDDVLRRGRDNIDWDVSLSWDFSDLIWNDAQTSIDVRSKLMVELRNDILDQVNKLYFERLRVKSELDNLALEDRNKRFDKQLKFQELTASLDALTSGYYSEQLRLLGEKQQV